MQGTYDDPGISQFRLLWATNIARTNRTRIRKIDRHHSRLFILHPSPAKRLLFKVHGVGFGAGS
jgi:hypothetical protein